MNHFLIVAGRCARRATILALLAAAALLVPPLGDRSHGFLTAGEIVLGAVYLAGAVGGFAWLLRPIRENTAKAWAATLLLAAAIGTLTVLS